MKELDDSTNLAVGMSSLGPLVYAIDATSSAGTEVIVRKLCARYRGQFLGSFSG